jgi:SAM-dependent methyltransferase
VPSERFRQRLRRLSRPAWLGTLRRTSPLSTRWGTDRGTPVDRHFIAGFLAECSGDIHGRVLEVGSSQYARRFGRGVTSIDVLDINPGNPSATIVADLSAADAIASDTFDCCILTQTLQFVYDVAAAIDHAHRIMRPGGVLLATLPGITRVDPSLAHTDFWRFTPPACQRLFERPFGAGQVEVRSYGNVLTAVAFLAGMASEELSSRELAAHDVEFPLLVSVRAVRRSSHG